MKKILNTTFLVIILNIIISLDVLAFDLKKEEINKKLEIYEVKTTDVIKEFNGNIVEFYIKHHDLIIVEEVKEDEQIEEFKGIVEEVIEEPEPFTYDINPVIENRDVTMLNEIVEFAKQFVGNPYVYGGTSLTDGADCSGFIQSVYLNFGISLSRSAVSQSFDGYGISVNDIDMGDIISYGYNGQVTHSALYIGDGMIIHASTPEGGIRIDHMHIMPIITVRRIIN